MHDEIYNDPTQRRRVLLSDLSELLRQSKLSMNVSFTQGDEDDPTAWYCYVSMYLRAPDGTLLLSDVAYARLPTITFS